MPITFSTEIDQKSIRHVNTRSKRNREVELEPLPTAADVARWNNNPLPQFPPLYQPNYNDGVEDRRNAEKARRDAEARKRISTEPATPNAAFANDLQVTHVRGTKTTTAGQRAVAQILKKNAELLNWSCYMDDMSGPTVAAIARRCAHAPDPVLAWNVNVSLAHRRTPTAVSFQVQPAYRAPGTEVKGHSVALFTPKKNNKEMVDAWMKAAELDILPHRSTKCAATGRSLVVRDEHGWRIERSVNGIGLEVAQQIAVAAAIKAGFARGFVRGSPPALVGSLVEDPQAWLSLVIATQHPLFYSLAMKISQKALQPAEPTVMWRNFAEIRTQEGL